MNMQNSYVEEIIKRKDPAYAIPAKIGTAVLCMLGIILAMTTLAGIVVLAAAAVLAYFVWLNLKVEFEYLYIDGAFSADKILNKSRRKKMLDSGKEDLVMIAPKDSTEAKDAMGRNAKVMDLSSGKPDAKVYAYVYRSNGELRAAYIEPNEDMLKHMRYFTPSKVKL